MILIQRFAKPIRRTNGGARDLPSLTRRVDPSTSVPLILIRARHNPLGRSRRTRAARSILTYRLHASRRSRNLA